VNQADLVVLALTSRIVTSPAKPLSAGEFWRLCRGGSIADLVSIAPAELASTFGLSNDEAGRVEALLERRTALALAVEQLEHKGTWTITSAAEGYPRRIVDRLNDEAPAVLHGVGDAALLPTEAIGIVGSRDIDDDAADVTRRVAAAVAEGGYSVVTGGAQGVDQLAMNTAFGIGGPVVGVLADSLERAIAKPSTRQGVSRGGICLVTPYAPAAGFTPASAMGRNKIVYALSKTVVVVRSNLESGGTWSGATEALNRGYANVASWVGPGSASGNQRLVELGAQPIAALDDLASILAAPERPAVASQPADQLSLPL
jgi:predicted Rossmann fold nucleotide-binding protein DprA/Smf involved in DNA uptake